LGSCERQKELTRDLGQWVAAPLQMETADGQAILANISATCTRLGLLPSKWSRSLIRTAALPPPFLQTSSLSGASGKSCRPRGVAG
jgi:hypothetical protein